MKKAKEFETTFRKTVDCGLNQIFGQVAALIILKHLEKSDSITPEEIPKRLDAFAKGLESFLGAGALVVEETILKSLYASYGLVFKEIEEGTSFVNYIIQLRSTVDGNVKKAGVPSFKINVGSP